MGSQHWMPRGRPDCSLWNGRQRRIETRTADRAMSGYRRLETHGIGAGAAEILRAVLADAGGGHPSNVVGSVHRVFDTSVYIKFKSQYTQAIEMPGPRLVVIGGPTFSGPLSLRVQPDEPRGFDPNQISTGTRCRLRTATTGEGGGTSHVLAIGSALEIECKSDLLEPLPPTAWRPVELESIHPESDIWRNAAAAVARLTESEAMDGLGWLNHLGGATESPRIPEELERLVDACVQAVKSGWDTDPPDAGRDLLGRGPGATPSGDDILAGIFLMLLRTTTGEAHRHVRQAGDHLVKAAEHRTTSISTALLAQAARGRAADPILDAREALLTPQMDTEGRRAALSNIRNIGHTSGLDTLVGMLVALLYIGPNLPTSE